MDAPGRGSRPVTARSVLGFIVVLALLGPILTDALIPFAGSHRGRWREVTLDDPTLGAQRQLRLVVPPGRVWTSIEFQIGLVEDEALDIILDRHGSTFDLLRLSRAESLDSALLHFEDDAVVSRQPLPLDPALFARRGKLVLRRVATGIEAAFDGRELATVASRDPGQLDLLLFPPWRVAVERRCRLVQYSLDDGEVVRGRDPLASGLTWAACLTTIGLAFAGARSLASGWGARLLERLLPFHARRHHRHVEVFLGVVALLAIGLTVQVAIAGAVSWAGAARRPILIVAMTIALPWTACGMALHDRLAARIPRLAAHVLWSAPFVPVVLGIYLGATIMALHYLTSLDDRTSRPAQQAPSDAWPRVACYGASVTLGEPFEDSSPHTYPNQLQSQLRASGYPRALVWNRAFVGADIVTIEKKVREDLGRIAPTHAVVYSLRNNLSISLTQERVGDTYGRVAALLTSRVPQVMFVEEVNFDSVYHPDRARDVADLVATVARVAGENGVAWLPMSPAFRARRDEFLFFDRRAHLVANGYRRVAEATAAWVEATSATGGHPVETSVPGQKSE